MIKSQHREIRKLARQFKKAMDNQLGLAVHFAISAIDGKFWKWTPSIMKEYCKLTDTNEKIVSMFEKMMQMWNFEMISKGSVTTKPVLGQDALTDILLDAIDHPDNYKNYKITTHDAGWDIKRIEIDVLPYNKKNNDE